MRFREPLLLPALGLLTGVTLADAALVTPTDATALSAIGVFAFWRPLPLWLKGAIILLAALGIGALAHAARKPPPKPQLPFQPNQLMALEGCVVEPLVEFEGRAQFTVELQPGARAIATLYPKEGTAAPALAYGERIAFDARLREPDRFRNPGSFNYPAFLARRHIYWTASLAANRPVRRLPGQCGTRAAQLLSGLRHRLLARMETTFAGDAYRVGMMQALLLGDSQKVRKIWTEDFRQTGTFHALVISGQHVAVLASLVVFLFHRLLHRPMLAYVLAALLAWIYALVAGFTAPVVRAAAGLSLFLLARFTFREGRVLNVLAGVAGAFVLLDPGQILEASFHLSFLAVAAIGGLAAPLIDRYVKPYSTGLTGLAEPERDLPLDPRTQAFRLELRLLAETLHLWTRLPERLSLRVIALAGSAAFLAAETLLLSALVQMALALPTVLYFHRFPVTGLSANLFIVPLLSLAVPIGFAATLTGSSVLAAVAGLLLDGSRAVAAWHVPLEPHWRIPDPPWWLAGVFVLAIVTWMFTLRRERFAWAGALGATATLGVLLAHPFPPAVARGSLELTAIDVGQGDGLFLSLPAGPLLAIDSGGFPGFARGGRLIERRQPRMDIGEDVISPYLWTRSLQALDVLVLTHAHADHIGGMAALIDNFSPREIWTGLMPPANADWQAVRRKAAARGIRLRQPRAGDTWRYGGAEFQALAPFPGDEPGEEAHNNDSLVLLVRHGRHRFLLTGDAESRLEGRIAEGWAGGRVDVLKVGHHGSRTSTSAALLDAFQPAFAVISCGRANSFRHPHPLVTGRLTGRGIPIFRTDEHGLITVRSDGRYLTWSTPGTGRAILPALE